MNNDIEYLKFYQEIGIDYYSMKNDKSPDIKNDNMQKIINPDKIKPHEEWVLDAKSSADKANSISELKKYVEDFQGCKLKFIAKNTVFCDGNEGANVMIIGEAPGKNEDEEGIPFCGQSGKLLDKILASINLTREKTLYITNTLFWRPPANRRPTEEENELCLPFVEKHIALFNPKVLILVGATATTTLLKTDLAISKLRKECHAYENKYTKQPIKTCVTFHPAYLLRQGLQKRLAWEDMLKIQKYMRENNIV